MESKLIHIC